MENPSNNHLLAGSRAARSADTAGSAARSHALRPHLSKHRRSKEKTVGVIDIGSNSVRLVVYEELTRSLAPIFNEKVLCGLGRTVASTGRLDADAVERAIEALRRFHAINRVLGVKNVRVIATAAVREAANGPEFIARGAQAIGTEISVLSGAREAELAASPYAKALQYAFFAERKAAEDLGYSHMNLISGASRRLFGPDRNRLGTDRACRCDRLFLFPASLGVANPHAHRPIRDQRVAPEVVQS